MKAFGVSYFQANAAMLKLTDHQWVVVSAMGRDVPLAVKAGALAAGTVANAASGAYILLDKLGDAINKADPWWLVKF